MKLELLIFVKSLLPPSDIRGSKFFDHNIVCKNISCDVGLSGSSNPLNTQLYDSYGSEIGIGHSNADSQEFTVIKTVVVASGPVS
jgi:hypothetical protein